MTNTTRRSLPSARQAFKEEKEHAIEMLQRLLAKMQEMPNFETWPEVGDMQATTSELREICDRVFGEGEYAAS